MEKKSPRQGNKLEEVRCCPHCKNPKFNNPQRIGGHLKYCHARPVVERFIHAFEPEDNSELDLVEEEFHDIFAELSGEFITRQRALLSKEAIDNLAAGRIKLLNGKYAKAEIRVYLEIGAFISKCHGFSHDDASGLLQLLKRVSHINGKEIPLPQRNSTLRDNILSTMTARSGNYARVEFPMPESLFGTEASMLPKAVSVMCPLLDSLSRRLLDNKLVGEK